MTVYTTFNKYKFSRNTYPASVGPPVSRECDNCGYKFKVSIGTNMIYRCSVPVVVMYCANDSCSIYVRACTFLHFMYAYLLCRYVRTCVHYN